MARLTARTATPILDRSLSEAEVRLFRGGAVLRADLTFEEARDNGLLPGDCLGREVLLPIAPDDLPPIGDLFERARVVSGEAIGGNVGDTGTPGTPPDAVRLTVESALSREPYYVLRLDSFRP